MTPELGKIYHGDCVDVMRQFPDKCFDLCLTDFPYGIGEEYASFSDTQENLKDLIAKAMPEILRVSKRALITYGVTNIFHYPRPAWVLNWTTPAGTGCSPWGFCCWQPILAYGKDPYLAAASGSLPDAYVHTEAAEKNGHPCPKPIQIWKKILLRGSNKETDLIFDPFMGSGTTAIACEHLNRKWVGCEMDAKYVEIALKRLDVEKAQMRMF